MVIGGYGWLWVVTGVTGGYGGYFEFDPGFDVLCCFLLYLVALWLHFDCIWLYFGCTLVIIVEGGCLPP